jgi:DNA polymerase III epsilon subunit-like protein
MSSPKRPPAPIEPPPPKQRKCGVCGRFGHNRRNCPAIAQKVAVDTGRKRKKRNENENAVEIPDSAPPPDPAPLVEAFQMDWDRVLYVIFDLETTGRQREQDEIIEIAAVVLDPFGIEIEDASFSQFIRPLRPIPPLITNLTSITNDMVSLADTFPVVAESFFTFIKEIADDRPGISEIFLVGHNSKVFDIPWLMHQLKVHDLIHLLLGDGRFNFGLDTLYIAKKSIRSNQNVGSYS